MAYTGRRFIPDYGQTCPCYAPGCRDKKYRCSYKPRIISRQDNFGWSNDVVREKVRTFGQRRDSPDVGEDSAAGVAPRGRSLPLIVATIISAIVILALLAGVAVLVANLVTKSDGDEPMKNRTTAAGMNEVSILKDGYVYITADEVHADCTMALVKSSRSTIFFDTGLPLDKEFILKALSDRGLKCSDITHVVCSHGHSDHVGNQNLFPDALFVVGYDIVQGDVYYEHNLAKGETYVIDEGVEVVATPGHTYTDVSLVVRNTTIGTVLLAGDTFENEDDIENPSYWKEVSYFPRMQAASRYNVVVRFSVDYIAPGHGEMFPLTEDLVKLLAIQANSTYDA